MKTTGQVDYATLIAELTTLLGPKGPWWVQGYSTKAEDGSELQVVEVFTKPDFPCDREAVQALLDAHVADAPKRAHNAEIQRQIEALEASVTPRRMREALSDPGWIQGVEGEINALRARRK